MTSLDERPVLPGRLDWVEICELGRLTPDRGVAALVGESHVAVFLLSSGDLHAVSNIDPVSGASVLSRGIVGDADGVPTVASPLYKQRFDLRSGACLDADVAPLPVYDVVVDRRTVFVAVRR